jgi:hypothetical protein
VASPGGYDRAMTTRSKTARPALVLEVGTVASRKEAEWHAAAMKERGCSCCGHALHARHERDDSDGPVHTMICDSCGQQFVLKYLAGEGWDDQPEPFEPRITRRRAPSPLLEPAYLLRRSERAAMQARGQPRPVAVSYASTALAAVDELEKFPDVPGPVLARFKKLKKALRGYLS